MDITYASNRMIVDNIDSVPHLLRLGSDIFQRMIDFGFLNFEHLVQMMFVGSMELNQLLLHRLKRIKVYSSTAYRNSKLIPISTQHFMRFSISVIRLDLSTHETFPAITWPTTLCKFHIQSHFQCGRPEFVSSIRRMVSSLSASNLPNLTHLSFLLPGTSIAPVHSEFIQLLCNVSSTLTCLKIIVCLPLLLAMFGSSDCPRDLPKLNRLTEASIELFHGVVRVDMNVAQDAMIWLLRNMIPSTLPTLKLSAWHIFPTPLDVLRCIPADVIGLKLIKMFQLSDCSAELICASLPPKVTRLKLSKHVSKYLIPSVSWNMLPFLPASITDFCLPEHRQDSSLASAMGRHPPFLPPNLQRLNMICPDNDGLEWLEKVDLSHIKTLTLSHDCDMSSICPHTIIFRKGLRFPSVVTLDATKLERMLERFAALRPAPYFPPHSLGTMFTSLKKMSLTLRYNSVIRLLPLTLTKLSISSQVVREMELSLLTNLERLEYRELAFLITQPPFASLPSSLKKLVIYGSIHVDDVQKFVDRARQLISHDCILSMRHTTDRSGWASSGD